MKELYKNALRKMTLKELAQAYYAWLMETDEFWNLVAEVRNEG